MGTPPLLLLTTGLSLFSAVRAEVPLMTPAHADKLLGKWYINLWAGNLPIPQWRLAYPLPPFLLVRNELKELEFRMNITKSIGCIPYKLSMRVHGAGMFHTWWNHWVYIYFLPERGYAMAYYRDYIDKQYYQIMMLMGRTLEINPRAVQIFKEFVEARLENATIITPRHADACELPRNS